MHSSDFLWMFFSFAITNSSYLLAVSGTKPDVGPLQAFGCLDTQWCSVRGRAKSSESQMRFHQVSEMCWQPAGFCLNVNINININRNNSSSEITQILGQCQYILAHLLNICEVVLKVRGHPATVLSLQQNTKD